LKQFGRWLVEQWGPQKSEFYPLTIENHEIIKKFLDNSRHLFVEDGETEISRLLEAGEGWLAETAGKLWGMIILQAKDCSAYPAPRPDVRSVKLIALARGRSPSQDVPILLQQATDHLDRVGSAYQIFIYGSSRWVKQPFLGIDFETVERVQHLQLDYLGRRIDQLQPSVLPTLPALEIRPAREDEYIALAQLDAAAFDPIWHWSQSALRRLTQSHRLQVAIHQGKLAGYSALRLQVPDFAHLARLAVAPAEQGKRLGQRLLIDVLQHAHEYQIPSIGLNTQASNHRALRLYRSFGFRPTGHIDPTLVKNVGHRVDVPQAGMYT